MKTPKHIDREMVRFILDNVENEDKDLFILELIEGVNKKIKTGDSTALDQCLAGWEATAEVNSIPGCREGTLESLEALRKIGVIK